MINNNDNNKITMIAILDKIIIIVTIVMIKNKMRKNK